MNAFVYIDIIGQNGKKLCIFRAIFDLSNKITLLILLWMYALYVKGTKIEILCPKVKIVQTQLKSAWLSLTQLDSAWLNLTQLDPTWFKFAKSD